MLRTLYAIGRGQRWTCTSIAARWLRSCPSIRWKSWQHSPTRLWRVKYAVEWAFRTRKNNRPVEKLYDGAWRRVDTCRDTAAEPVGEHHFRRCSTAGLVMGQEVMR